MLACAPETSTRSDTTHVRRQRSTFGPEYHRDAGTPAVWVRGRGIRPLLCRDAAGGGPAGAHLVQPRTELHHLRDPAHEGRGADPREPDRRVRHPAAGAGRTNRGLHRQGVEDRRRRLAGLRAARLLPNHRNRTRPDRASLHHEVGGPRGQVRQPGVVCAAQAQRGAGRTVARPGGRLQDSRLRPRSAAGKGALRPYLALHDADDQLLRDLRRPA